MEHISDAVKKKSNQVPGAAEEISSALLHATDSAAIRSTAGVPSGSKISVGARDTAKSAGSSSVVQGAVSEQSAQKMASSVAPTAAASHRAQSPNDPINSSASAAGEDAAACPEIQADEPKTPPAVSEPIVTEARAAAVAELRARNAAARAQAAELGVKMPVKKKKAPREPIMLSLDRLLLIILLTALSGWLVLAWLLKPSWWYLSTFLVIGAGMGLALSFVYYWNKKTQAETCQSLGVSLGLKGMQYLVGQLPSWLSYTEKEKVEWLNSLVSEVWPFMDRAASAKVKEQVEAVFVEVLRTQKVPIRAIGFQQLTFGEAPFRVENIYVNDKSTKYLELEMDLRWCGDANITLAVEVAGTMGEFSKVCPQITDISVVATTKIRLGPLCDKIPGFAAIMFCFTKQPRIKYRMNMGKALGGSVVSGVVKPFINNILTNQLNALLVWPQRMVIPLPPSFKELYESPEIMRGVMAMGNYQQGMIKIEVIKAEKLLAADWSLRGASTSDPYVELTTDGRYTAKTKVMKKTVNPSWNQTFWLLVQEPQSQEMQVTVSDYDLGSGSEILGRCLVNLAPITATEPNPLTQWYHLGSGDWSEPGGCGKGRGRLQLKIMYRSFHNFGLNESKEATMGVLVVRVTRVSGVSRSRKPTTVFCKFFCNDDNYVTAPVMAKGGEDHVFGVRNSQEFHNVRFDTDVKVTVHERGLGDEELGFIEMPITDIAECQDPNPLTGEPLGGTLVRTLKLEESDRGHIHVVLRYLPYY